MKPLEMDGMLGREIDCFKADCRSKSKAAKELAENISSECLDPLKEMVTG